MIFLDLVGFGGVAFSGGCVIMPNWPIKVEKGIVGVDEMGVGAECG